MEDRHVWGLHLLLLLRRRRREERMEAGNRHVRGLHLLLLSRRRRRREERMEAGIMLADRTDMLGTSATS